MKKILSSVVLLITAAVLCCGCSGGSENKTAQSDADKNYFAENVKTTPIVTKLDVVSMKDVNPSEIAKTDVFKVKSAEVTYDQQYLIVTYSFHNTADYERSFNDVLIGGSVTAYQQGVQISGSTSGDIDQNTPVMGGATVDIVKKYALRSTEDPVTLYAASEFLVTLDIFVHKELTFGYKTNEKSIGSTHYKCSLNGAGFTDDGSIIVDYSFTNNSDARVTPASVLAIQSFQGDGSFNAMSSTKESMTDETHYLKYYYAEPGQTVDFSTKFKLNNTSDEVVVYLTEPSSGEIYDKKIYKVR